MAATNAHDPDVQMCDYWHMVAISILYWDHLLTLKTEARCLWKPPSNLSKYVFFLHRYYNALAMAFVFWSLFTSGMGVSCHALVNLREGLLIFAQLVVVFVLTLRIYALYGCNRRFLYVMLSVVTVFLTTVACVATFYKHSKQSKLSSGSCRTQLDFESSIRQAVAWEILFLYDVLLFALALYNAFKTRRELRVLSRSRVSLKVILLRDGALYFGAMGLINLANICTYYFAQGCMRGGLAPVASSLSVTLVSRLMLNLHEAMDIGIYSSQYTGNGYISEPEIETRMVFYEDRPSDRRRRSIDSDGSLFRS